MSERIIVTGAAGFIGSNIVRGLNARGITDIIAVDNLTQGDKFHNLCDLKICDYIDKTVFYEAFAKHHYGHIGAVFHQGACSDTMQHDGRYMMANNYATSKTLLDVCLEAGTRLFYASSAATYGASTTFIEDPQYERPLNVYGYSKLLFDQVVRRVLRKANHQIVGLRYFNIYGPRENHKARMASVAFHQFNQFSKEGKVKLFGAYGGYGPGEQLRDFTYVDDVVAINLWFFDNPDKRGIFNVGSGQAHPFNDVAKAVINTLRTQREGKSALSLQQMVDEQLLEYVPMPDALVGKYQCFTEANLHALRQLGCNHVFANVEQGVSAYINHLLMQENTNA